MVCQIIAFGAELELGRLVQSEGALDGEVQIGVAWAFDRVAFLIAERAGRGRREGRIGRSVEPLRNGVRRVLVGVMGYVGTIGVFTGVAVIRTVIDGEGAASLPLEDSSQSPAAGQRRACAAGEELLIVSKRKVIDRAYDEALTYIEV